MTYASGRHQHSVRTLAHRARIGLHSGLVEGSSAGDGELGLLSVRGLVGDGIDVDSTRNDRQRPRNRQEHDGRPRQSADADGKLFLDFGARTESREEHDGAVRHGSQDGQHDGPHYRRDRRDQQQELGAVGDEVRSVEENERVGGGEGEELDDSAKGRVEFGLLAWFETALVGEEARANESRGIKSLESPSPIVELFPRARGRRRSRRAILRLWNTVCI